MKHFKLLKQKKLLSTPWLQVSANDYLLPNGKRLEDFYVVTEKSGVTTVALTPEKKILIVEQYRPAVDDVTICLPGGLLDDDEKDPLQQAQEELLEETGYESDQWIELGKFYPAPHRMSTVQKCYLALDVKKVAAQNLDATEFVQYKSVTMAELEDLIQQGKFNCGYCMTTYLKAKLYLEQYK